MSNVLLLDYFFIAKTLINCEALKIINALNYTKQKLWFATMNLNATLWEVNHTPKRNNDYILHLK